MNLSSEGYEILLLVVFPNHKLLVAERTFWRSVTACFLLLVHFLRCMSEAECSARCTFALTLWSFLHVFEAQLTAHERSLKEIGFFRVLSTVTSWAENNDSHTKKTL